MRRSMLFSLCLLVLFHCQNLIAGPIPDTGQTTCYDDQGNVLDPCPAEGEPFYGQDGNYLINPPSYTKIDASGDDLPNDATEWVMVRDNVTGLIWEVKTDDGTVHDKDNQYTWYDSNPNTNGGVAGTPGDGTDTEDLINDLNMTEFGGYTDWRLPTREELRSIIDYTRFNPAVNGDYFPNTVSDYYWSSSTAIQGTGYAWNVFFRSGGDNNDYLKSLSCYIRAVRGGNPGQTYLDNQDGTVTDTNTGLMWQQEPPTAYTYDWREALAYCEGLVLAGHDDWRLPTIIELASLVDLSNVDPAANLQLFPYTQMSPYWSSSNVVFDNNRTWLMDFGFGNTSGQSRSASCYFRAVRGGQRRLLDHLIISEPKQGDRWKIGTTNQITWDTQSLGGNVDIALSRSGGRKGTFNLIAEDVPNNGIFDYAVTWPGSSNCVLKITPRSDPTKLTTQGLFTITKVKGTYVEAKKEDDTSVYSLTLNRIFSDGIFPTDVSWSVDPLPIATINKNQLTGLDNGRVTVSADYDANTYSTGLFVYTTLEAYEIEPNNTSETADSMTAGTFYQAGFYDIDEDWYSFTLAADKLVDVGYLSQSNSADMQVEIYNAADQLLASQVSTNGTHLNFPLGLFAGTYYIKVTTTGDVDQNNDYIIVYETVGDLSAKSTTVLDIGDEVFESLYHLQDQSLFTFSLNEPTALDILFQPSGGLANYRVELLDDSQTVVDQVESLEYTLVNLFTFQPPGNYTLRVTPINQVDALHPFSIGMQTTTNQLEREPNNDFDNASYFTTDSSILGKLSEDTDVDIFGFTLDVPRHVNLGFICPGSTSDFTLSLYKDSGTNLIDGISTQNGHDISIDMGLSIGTYYLKVVGFGTPVETNLPYRITIGDAIQTNLEIESNNTIKFANAIAKDNPLNGRVYSASDLDIYAFHLDDQVLFTCDLTPSTSTADYRLKLMDENAQVIDQRTSQDGSNVTWNLFRSPGNYFLQVESNGDIDQFNPYEISLAGSANITPLQQLVGITITGTTHVMTAGDRQTLSAYAGYNDATADLIGNPVWESLKNSVAIVDTAGEVTAIGSGTTSIVATYAGFSNKFDIAVDDPAPDVDQHYGNLIIVAGGGPDSDDPLYPTTQYLSDLVYQRFQQRFFSKEDIFYFNPQSFHDLDGDGYDNGIVDNDNPTVSAFENAITSWAVDQSTDGPLYIYLLNHGGIDSFEVNTGEILTATHLRGAIDTFRTITGREVIVMIEACKSGSFTDDIAGQGIAAVTCTDRNNAYQDLNGRVSFTQFFVDRLVAGDSVANAFQFAETSLSSIGIPFSTMKPQLVEGNAICASTYIGGSYTVASLFPDIIAQSPDTSITAGTSHTLYAELSDLDGIEAVWTVVLTPDYITPPTGEDFTVPEINLPSLDLNDPDKDGRFEGTFSDFTYNGTYQFVFYARNQNGSVAVSAPTLINVSGGITPPVATLAVSPDFCDIDAEAGTIFFSVDNLGSETMVWTVASNNSWLTVQSGSTGIDSGMIVVEFTHNDGAARTGTITVTADEARNSPQVLEVKQKSEIRWLPFIPLLLLNE